MKPVVITGLNSFNVNLLSCFLKAGVGLSWVSLGWITEYFPFTRYQFYSFVAKLVNVLLQKQWLEVFSKNVFFKNFAKFTGKHVCQSLFFNKVASLNTFFTEHLWTTASVIINNLTEWPYCWDLNVRGRFFWNFDLYYCAKIKIQN